MEKYAREGRLTYNFYLEKKNYDRGVGFRKENGI